MSEHEKVHHPNYWLIWVILAVLTGVEVWASDWPFEKKTLIFILVGFAVVKAVLVAFYFMHLKFEWARARIIYLLAIGPFLFVAAFVYHFLPDIADIDRYLPF